MAFTSQSLHWPADRAVLFVHGIGDASTGGDGAFPLDALRSVLGADASRVATYHVQYDFINDWIARKTEFAGELAALRRTLRFRFGNDALATTIAEYAGDVLWPVLSADLRFAVRDALLAQLDQIQIDRGESALARGDDPLDYRISIVAHSLGCFHTYETLWAASADPAHRLRPRSDLFTLHAVVMMASPVQLIRTAVSAIRALVPQADTLYTLAPSLGIPAETRGSTTTRCTPRFVAVTGNQDPVGGHLLGRRQPWAYMDLPGQESIVEPQQVVSRDGLSSALTSHAGDPVQDPHSWTAYIEREATLLRRLLAT